MNLTHKKSLVLAVATALGMITPLAQASIITSLVDGSDTTARKFAIEEQGEATKDYYGLTRGTAASDIMVDQDLTILVPVISGYTVTQANRMTVRLTLTGGAKFANKPYLVCSHTAYDAAGNLSQLTDSTWFNMAKNAGGALCLLSAVGGQLREGGNANCTTAANTVNAASAFLMSPDTGGKGSVTATYIFPEKLITRVGVAGASGAGCILTFGQGDDFTKLQSAGIASTNSNSAFVTAFSIGARQDIGLKTEVIYVDAGVNNTKPFEGTIIKFVTAIAPRFVQGDPRTIDVKKASKEFTDGTIVEIGQFALSAGQTTEPRFSRSWESGAVGLTTTKTLVSGVSITISGPTIAGAKQAWLVANADTCQGGTRYGLAQVAATSGASTLILGASGIGDPTTSPNYFTNAPNGLKICLEVKGTDLLSDGQLTASFAGLAKSTSFLLDPGASSSDLSKITRNGAVVRVLNVPAKDNADQTFLRFYNSSSLPTTVRATLYGADGKAIGTDNATLFDTLKANDVEILDAAKLEAKIGAPWSGRAWLLIQADVSTEFFKVQSMIRAPGTPGVLINVSGEAYN